MGPGAGVTVGHSRSADVRKCKGRVAVRNSWVLGKIGRIVFVFRCEWVKLHSTHRVRQAGGCLSDSLHLGLCSTILAYSQNHRLRASRKPRRNRIRSGELLAEGLDGGGPSLGWAFANATGGSHHSRRRLSRCGTLRGSSYSSMSHTASKARPGSTRSKIIIIVLLVVEARERMVNALRTAKLFSLEFLSLVVIWLSDWLRKESLIWTQLRATETAGW